MQRPVLLLFTALSIGAIGQVLFHPGTLGINLLLFLAALSAGLGVFARLASIPLAGQGKWLLTPALLFAGAVAWRASPVMQALNTAAVVAILAVAAFRFREGRIRLGFVAEAFWQAGVAILVAVSGAFGALKRMNWAGLSARDTSGRFRAIGRGVLIAVPLLLLFGALFALADAVFLDYLQSATAWDAGRFIRHGFGWLFWSWLSAGVLCGLLGSEPQPAPRLQPVPWARLGPVEVGTVLGLVDLLFLGFVAIQIHYLFGGAGHVEATAGLTYAEYARRGFFELLAVAALVLPVVLGIHWLLRESSPVVRIAFRLLASTLILLLFVVIASALERMRAYTGEFGLTQLRLYATAAMLALAVFSAWLVASLVRERRQQVMGGAFVTTLVAVFALNVLNPDAFIVRTNLDRANRDFDAAYALSLSPDATPTIVAGISRVANAETRCALAAGVVSEYPSSRPWQGWTLSHSRADDTIGEKAALLGSACTDGAPPAR